jgi:hypothetical protein
MRLIAQPLAVASADDYDNTPQGEAVLLMKERTQKRTIYYSE